MSTPIFVIGMPRSGTTLTAKILGKHSRIFMPGETHFFDDIYSRRNALGDPQASHAMAQIVERLATLYGRYNEPEDQERIDKLFAEPAVIEGLKTSCTSYRDILSFFMSVQTQHAGKIRWGNNVPKDLFSIKEILSFYPGAKIIVCLRDIRDFLLSYQNKWQVTSQENIQRLQNIYHPIMTSLLWKSSVKQIAAVKSLVPNENLMIIQYELLVREPERIVRALCQFLGEIFESEMIHVDTNNSSFQEKNSGIFSSSVGRWHVNLSSEEVYISQKIAHHELLYLGYDIGKVTVEPLKIARLLMTLPYAFWKGMKANRAMRGPLMPYLARRMGVFFH